MLCIYYRVKHEHAQQKREVRKTGGGVPPPPISEEAEKVLSIIGSELNDLGCLYDSDAHPCKYHIWFSRVSYLTLC